MLELFNSDPFVWDELGKPNGTRILGVHPVLGDIGVRVRTDGSINLSFNANAINQEQVERMDLIQNEFKKAFVLTQERLGPKSTLTIIKQRTGTGINVEEKLGNSNSPDSNFELMQLLILNLSNAHR